MISGLERAREHDVEELVFERLRKERKRTLQVSSGKKTRLRREKKTPAGRRLQQSAWDVKDET